MLNFGRIAGNMGMFSAVKNVLQRTFYHNGYELLAKSGTTSKGVKWTKLYNAEGDLVSWKSSLNGKIKKGRYEKIDPFDYETPGLSVSYPTRNKRVANVKFNGFESQNIPKRTLKDSYSSDILDKYNPLSSNYEPFSPNLSDDIFTNPWDKNPWDL